ncbi:MAG: hypothetical protein ABJN40_22235 [Sneathiella sp.]
MKQTMAFLLVPLVLLSTPLSIAAAQSSEKVKSNFSTQSAIPAPANGAKEYPDYFLTQDQLKECISIEASMGMLTGYLQKRDSLFTDLKTELADLQTQISAVEAYFKENPNVTVDDEEAFKTRNEMVRKNNNLVDGYNQKLANYTQLEKAYNDDVSSFNALSQTFESDCNGKRYYADDLAAIRAAE